MEITLSEVLTAKEELERQIAAELLLACHDKLRAMGFEPTVEQLEPLDRAISSSITLTLGQASAGAIEGEITVMRTRAA